MPAPAPPISRGICFIIFISRLRCCVFSSGRRARVLPGRTMDIFYGTTIGAFCPTIFNARTGEEMTPLTTNWPRQKRLWISIAMNLNLVYSPSLWQLARLLINVIYGELARVWLFVIYTWACRLEWKRIEKTRIDGEPTGETLIARETDNNDPPRTLSASLRRVTAMQSRVCARVYLPVQFRGNTGRVRSLILE